ncbi:patatin-domain-containing protein [Gonapodya prolifera JEL478]|uniref:Lysophospholipase NTE1 n=1 Tax=Gonapodya prolifera (strain JEL478) TaxID=1344416 RepID=A0A139AE34_GONPJ|nr:patatin-domain-containing protein [Gonapodya prolifera JEL478]|eukprot:KXS15086.1 patatin-domain-containing protein [Gonapodya prolifera JEL478]
MEWIGHILLQPILVTLSITLDTRTVVACAALMAVVAWVVVRYSLLTRYSRLPRPTQVKHVDAPLDLNPLLIPAPEDSDNETSGDLPGTAGFSASYSGHSAGAYTTFTQHSPTNTTYSPYSHFSLYSSPDDLLAAFLSSIRVFGYLDRNIFHELARSLTTRTLQQGEVLFSPDSPPSDFYIVVEGGVQVFSVNKPTESLPPPIPTSFPRSSSAHIPSLPSYIQTPLSPSASSATGFSFSHILSSTSANSAHSLPFDPASLHLLHEVKPGGAVSSLFQILDVFTEGVLLPEDRDMAVHEPGPGTAQRSSTTSPLGLERLPRPLQDTSYRRDDKHEQTRQGVYEASKNTVEEEHVDVEGAPAQVTTLDSDPDVFWHTGPPPIPPTAPESDATPLPPFSVPSTLALAARPTVLAVVPRAAFADIAKRFPKAAGHVAGVILARFARVVMGGVGRYIPLDSGVPLVDRLLSHPIHPSLTPPAALISRLLSSEEDPRTRPEGVVRISADGDSSWEERGADMERLVGLGGSRSAHGVTMRVGSGRTRGRTVTVIGLGEEPAASKRKVFSTSQDDDNDGSPEGSSSDLDRDDSPSVSSPTSSNATAHTSFSPADLAALKRHCYGAMRTALGADAPDSQLDEDNSPRLAPFNGDVQGLSPIALRLGDASKDSSGRSSQASPSGPGSESRAFGELEIRIYEAGVVVFAEGERAGGVVMVLDGALEAAAEGLTENPAGGTAGQIGNRKYRSRHAAKARSYHVTVGGLAGYLSAMMSHPVPVTVRATVPTVVAFLPKPALDRLLERSPRAVFALARRIITRVTPSALRVDMASDWVQLQAGQVVFRQGERAESVVVVLGGRLRSIIEADDGTSDDGTEADEDNERGTRFDAQRKLGAHRRGGRSNDALAPDSPPLRATPGFGSESNNQTWNQPSTPSPPNTQRRPAFTIEAEHGPGDSIGELEVLTDARRPATVHAIRDSEVAVLPRTLLEALASVNPEVTMAVSRIVAGRAATGRSGSVGSRNWGLSPGSFNVPSYMPAVGSGGGASARDSGVGLDNANLRTVAVLPVTSAVPVLEFAAQLRSALVAEGCSPVSVLTSDRVVGWLGRHAFSRVGKLKLVSWLAEMEEASGMVLYVADGGVGSPWTQRCIRQADCILLVGLGDEDPAIGELETILIGMKTTARKELVLIHSERYVIPGSTAQWLQNRTWVHAHHHLQMANRPKNSARKTAFNLASQIQSLTSHAFLYSLGTSGQFHDVSMSNLQSTTESNIRADFRRLARRLLGKSVGLVLGGGGARGIAHVGVIKALEEAGVPIDMVGGTSIGSFVGGLMARESDYVSVVGRAKMFSSRMSSPWRQLMDLTYPSLSWFSGHEFNRSLWKCFSDLHIEDCWLPYFVNTTNVTWSTMEVHRSGYMWRYVRASMSLSGFLPPLVDNGNMLVDGGYISNLPADIMRALGAAYVIAVDVGALDDTKPVHFGDTLSGLSVLWDRINPFRDTSRYQRIPNLADIQSRLAYVSSVRQLEEAKATDGVFYLRPPVTVYGTLQFGSFSEILNVGYAYGRSVVETWSLDGSLERIFGIRDTLQDSDTNREAKEAAKSRRGRRNSV